MHKPLLRGLSAAAMIAAVAACGGDDEVYEDDIAEDSSAFIEEDERDDVALPDATDTPPDRMAVDDSMLGDPQDQLDDVTADMSDQSIVDIATGDPRFSTLVTALEQAGLVETLAGDGPYTVFAPTNAAFEQLPAGTVETLMEPGNRSQLENILLYHVVSGETMSDQISGEMSVDTLAGEPLPVMASGGQVTVGGEGAAGAVVVTPDLQASNGVIHVIDQVLLPPAGQ